MVNEWDLKTKYQVAFADMIEQRTTMMKFLLDHYGIDAVEKFFLKENPGWAEHLKVGTMKKVFAKLLAKLLPRQLMAKLAEIIIENAQYLVGLENIAITESTDDYEIISITDCPVVKQFKRTLKALKFQNLEERYICTFGCFPVLRQMSAVGNCNLLAEYTEKGCQLKMALKPKAIEELELAESEEPVSLKNGNP
jgi:hypothetical protein